MASVSSTSLPLHARDSFYSKKEINPYIKRAVKKVLSCPNLGNLKVALLSQPNACKDLFTKTARKFNRQLLAIQRLANQADTPTSEIARHIEEIRENLFKTPIRTFASETDVIDSFLKNVVPQIIGCIGLHIIVDCFNSTNLPTDFRFDRPSPHKALFISHQEFRELITITACNVFRKFIEKWMYDRIRSTTATASATAPPTTPSLATISTSTATASAAAPVAPTTTPTTTAAPVTPTTTPTATIASQT